MYSAIVEELIHRIVDSDVLRVDQIDSIKFLKELRDEIPLHCQRFVDELDEALEDKCYELWLCKDCLRNLSVVKNFEDSEYMGTQVFETITSLKCDNCNKEL